MMTPLLIIIVNVLVILLLLWLETMRLYQLYLFILIPAGVIHHCLQHLAELLEERWVFNNCMIYSPIS